ncbi:MAG: NAD(P)-dependent alcohol dehydrogenase [Candidatus Hodarchaeales archaeon]
MKAIVYKKYGPPKEVLELKEIDRPTPKDNEMLVKIHAASVNAIDPLIVRGKPFYLRLTAGGILKPKRNHMILGDDIAGRVEEIGRNVQQFQPGDEVFGISNWGAFAEYRCVPEDLFAKKPTNISFEEAAAVPVAATTALLGLRDKKTIQPEHKVLINGASGGVGTFAVQIANYFGAEVTGVCSTSKLEMVSSIGADYVIDYTKNDYTKGGQLYDLILDVAAHRSIFDYKRTLSPKGRYVCIGGSGTRFFQVMLLGPLISIRGSKKIGSMLPIPKQKDLIFVKELLETGKLEPVIDKRYPLSEVAEAIQYFGEGYARGKVVITVDHNS